jgi:NAD-dependent DNA ligase
MEITCRLEKPKKAKVLLRLLLIHHTHNEPRNEPRNEPNKKSLKNQQIVFTGFRNRNWEEKIEGEGGRVHGCNKKCHISCCI